MEQHAMIKLLTVTEVTAQVANFYHCVKSVRDIVETGIKVLKYYIDDIDKGEETIETYTKKYSDFVYPCDENGEAPLECNYGMPFKEYDEDEIGIHWVEEDEFDWEEDEEE